MPGNLKASSGSRLPASASTSSIEQPLLDTLSQGQQQQQKQQKRASSKWGNMTVTVQVDSAADEPTGLRVMSSQRYKDLSTMLDADIDSPHHGGARAHNVIVRILDLSPSAPKVIVCKDITTLDEALIALPAKSWIHVDVVKKISADGENTFDSVGTSTLTMVEAMKRIQERCDLPPLSVRDALESSQRTKLDRDEDRSLYLALLAFSCAMDVELTSTVLSPRVQPSGPVQSFAKRLVSCGNDSAVKPAPANDGRGANLGRRSYSRGASSGSLMALMHSGETMLPDAVNQLPTGVHGNISAAAFGGGARTGPRGPVNNSRLADAIKPFWSRVCCFLTHHTVVTVFHKAELSGVADELFAAYGSANTHAFERSKGPSFVLYRVVESVVDLLPPVLGYYRTAIMAFEDRTFNTERPRMHEDIDQTKQLHLLQRELGLIALYLQPSDRALDTVVHMPDNNKIPEPPAGAAAATPTATCDAAGCSHADAPNHSASHAHHVHHGPLVTAEVGDYMEEVQEAVLSRLTELQSLQAAASDLMDLMFNLTGYRSTVSSQTLAGVSTLFLPLTWVAGVYGTNFLILPELTWGVADTTDVQPDGWAGGYFYFWMMSIFLFVVSAIVLRKLKVF